MGRKRKTGVVALVPPEEVSLKVDEAPQIVVVEKFTGLRLGCVECVERVRDVRFRPTFRERDERPSDKALAVVDLPEIRTEE